MNTKIVATIGPSSEPYVTLRELVEHGMDVARMNFSHCSYPEYRERRKMVRRASRECGRPVAILQDLQGPRIRVGEIPGGERKLAEGELVTFSTARETNPSIIFIDDPYLHADIKRGEAMYLANGALELVVRRVVGSRIQAEVVRGGTLKSRKAVNVPHTKLTASGLTAKDRRDVRFALREGVDFIAISFVQTADDVLALRKMVGKRAKVIAKIETALALEHIDEIIRASDAIMVARGDLGIEVAEERLPFLQKDLIRQAAWHGCGSITATQMLLSMVENPHPTRAEVSDIANAILDGTDGVMLSDETASGRYPVRALQTLVRVARHAEEYHFRKPNNL